MGASMLYLSYASFRNASSNESEGHPTDIPIIIYERERANLGSHSAAAHRLGMRRNTLYDWLEWAREHVTK